MILGVDYYPEQWPELRWAEDARLMKDLGLQLVRLAEFSWSRLEPSEGCFEWDWLDRVIALLSAQEIRVILGTPTAAPPAWLTRSYPETLPVDPQGRRAEFGARRHYCPNSPLYRQHTHRIVSALAARYGSDARIAGWQIDNEFGGGQTARCFCPNCAAAFRQWLQARYETLQALNREWGTVFWSQEYSDWEQITPPRPLEDPNPSHLLDYYRFSSDSFVSFQQLQLDLIREHAAEGQFVTHNFMGLYSDLDQFDLAEKLDFVAWDSYPTAQTDRWRPLLYPSGEDGSPPPSPFAYDAGDPLLTALAHDLTRGLKQAPFWVMEQQAGHVNWGRTNPAIRPGTVRLWTWHAVASGADAVLYFRWRSALSGQEQYHSGLLRHDASPDVGFGDLRLLQAEREQLAAVTAHPVQAQVALVMEYDDLWALQTQPHRQGFSFLRQLFVYYHALSRLGLTVDIVHPQANLRHYKLVIAPSAHLGSPDAVEGLERVARRGAAVLLGVRSGFKTPTNQVTDSPLPGVFRYISGCLVTDWHALPPGVSYAITSKIPGLEGAAGVWAEALKPPLMACREEDEADEAQVFRCLARYTNGPLSGRPALTEHAFGAGRALYLGWHPTLEQAQALLAHLAGELNLPVVPGLPPGLLFARRGPYRFLFNFTDDPLEAELDGQHYPVPPRNLQILGP